MKVTYIYDSKILNRVIPLEIEAVYNVQILEIEGVDNLKKLNDENQEIDLLIIHSLNYSSNIYDLAKNIMQRFPSLFIFFVYESSEKVAFQENHQSRCFNGISILEDLLDSFNLLFGAKVNKTSSEFSKISIDRIKHLDNIPSDLFVKLSKDKFVNIIKKGQLIDQNIVSRYKKKGIDFLYIRSCDFILFIDEMRKKISFENKDLSDETILDVKISMIGQVRDYIKIFGINEKVISEIDKVVESSISHVRASKDLLELLKNVTTNDDYISAHSFMVSYFSGAIALKMDWKTDLTLHKLGLASMLHDVTLTDNIAKHTDINSEKFLALPFAKQEKIKRHPLEVASLIQDIKDFCPDVDTIVLNHHELPDGLGYPRALSSTQVPQIAAVFIIAEYFVVRIIGHEISELLVEEIVGDMKNVFSKGSYRKPLEGFLKVLNL